MAGWVLMGDMKPGKKMGSYTGRMNVGQLLHLAHRAIRDGEDHVRIHVMRSDKAGTKSKRGYEYPQTMMDILAPPYNPEYSNNNDKPDDNNDKPDDNNGSGDKQDGADKIPF